jgi:radical SAM modification target selenobiotic family peptide
MDTKELKKLLAGIGIAGLITGVPVVSGVAGASG